MFQKGIRKRKKKLYRITNILSSFSGINGEDYIWRTRVTPELKKELAKSSCTIRLHEDTRKRTAQEGEEVISV
jgi:hypothetical protein